MLYSRFAKCIGLGSRNSGKACARGQLACRDRFKVLYGPGGAISVMSLGLSHRSEGDN